MANRPSPESNLLNLRAVKLPNVSEAGESIVVLDNADQTLKQSTNGAAFAALGGGGTKVYGGCYQIPNLLAISPAGLSQWTLNANAMILAASNADFALTADTFGLRYTGAGGTFQISAALNFIAGAAQRWLSQVTLNGNNLAALSVRLIAGQETTTNAWESSMAVSPTLVTLATNDELKWYFMQVAGALGSLTPKWNSISCVEV